MSTVVVVQHDPTTRERYAGWLRDAGYEVATCAGPEAPDYFCPALKHCGCLEPESTDAMVYDPCLVSQLNHPASERIIYRLRGWYPGKPIIVANSGEPRPELARLAEEDPGISLVDKPSQETLVETLRSALESALIAAG